MSGKNEAAFPVKTFTITLRDDGKQFILKRKNNGFSLFELLGILESEKNMLEVFLMRRRDKNQSAVLAAREVKRD